MPTAIRGNVNRAHELEDEVDELKERLEMERERNNDLATNEGLTEDNRNNHSRG